MTEEAMWIERAQSAEAQLKTLREATAPMVERVKQFKANFGIREKDNGEIVINYVKLVERLGLEGALELRRVIDEHYNVSGAPGEKPHLRVVHER